MNTYAADQPLDEDLEHGRADQGIQKSEDGVVDVPKTAHPDLTDEEDNDGHEDGEHCRCPDGNNLIAQRIRKFRIHDLAVLEGDGERAAGSWICVVDLSKYQLDMHVVEVDLLTPRPIAPSTAIVRMSTQTPLSHCPNVGREFSASG